MGWGERIKEQGACSISTPFLENDSESNALALVSSWSEAVRLVYHPSDGYIRTDELCRCYQIVGCTVHNVNVGNKCMMDDELSE